MVFITRHFAHVQFLISSSVNQGERDIVLLCTSIIFIFNMLFVFGRCWGGMVSGSVSLCSVGGGFIFLWMILNITFLLILHYVSYVLGC